jgi:hypothetical protein
MAVNHFIMNSPHFRAQVRITGRSWSHALREQLAGEGFTGRRHVANAIIGVSCGLVNQERIPHTTHAKLRRSILGTKTISCRIATDSRLFQRHKFMREDPVYPDACVWVNRAFSSM